MEKVTDMLVYITQKNTKMTPISDAELKDVDFAKLLEKELSILPSSDHSGFGQIEAGQAKKLEVLRAKVKVVARMNRIFKTLR